MAANNATIGSVEAHVLTGLNALFRQAFNRQQDTGSLKDFGVTEDSRLYFDLSTPGKFFDVNQPEAPSFQNPEKELVTK